MRSVRVPLGDRSYSIHVGAGLIPKAGEILRRCGLAAGPALIVTQHGIRDLYGASLERALLDSDFSPSYFLPPRSRSSEAAKSTTVLLKLIGAIAKLDGANRPPLIIALGGGVIGDLAGFAAGIYRRGIRIVQVPTTLTAQVDSAIGGKTAVDLPQGKNLLGVIHQPSLVLADCAALSSLGERIFSDGCAEVIKYGAIREEGLLSLMDRTGPDALRRSPKTLEEVVFRCARIKAGIVSKDELDRKGVRIVLNFGHTAGHGIEAAAQFSKRYTHGEAVGIGMLVACDISRSLGYLKDDGLTRRLERVLMKFRLPLGYRGLSPEDILSAMGFDKKSEGGKNRFVLISAPGRTHVVRDVPPAVIRQALENRKL